MVTPNVKWGALKMLSCRDGRQSGFESREFRVQIEVGVQIEVYDKGNKRQAVKLPVNLDLKSGKFG